MNRPAAPPPAGPLLDIGLLNLLPDAALQAGERRLAALLRCAGVPLRLHRLTLPAIARGAAARGHLAANDYRYSMPDHPLDGLFVTGAEPRAAALAGEAYWPELAAAIDWARDNTRSAIFSCLAAHAAVLHIDGVPRRRLAAKLFGLFAVAPAEPGGWRGMVSHSRWHDLAEADLAAAGWRVLGRLAGDSDGVDSSAVGGFGVDSSAAHAGGVDSFGKRVGGSRFLGLQGHPEYHAGTLGREYRRDVGRFLDGTSDSYPELPAGYYGDEAEAMLLRFRDVAERERSPERFASLPLVAPPRRAGKAGMAVLGAWLRSLAEEAR